MDNIHMSRPPPLCKPKVRLRVIKTSVVLPICVLDRTRFPLLTVACLMGAH